MDIEPLRPWIGRERSSSDEVSATQARRMAALLNQEPREWRSGDAIPAHWYCMLFGETARQGMIGHDGHPEKGSFLPPVPLPRRMFAGRRVEFRNELHIGEPVSRRSTIHDITPKTGRSGSMCFVTIRHEIAGEHGAAVVEEQDVVYREVARMPNVSHDETGVPPASAISSEYVAGSKVIPDNVMLFRYSAITFNGHRIHYDRDYAATVEGYSGLVVNGGLTMLLLWEHALREGVKFTKSASRNLKGLIADRPMYLDVEQRASGAVAVARDAQGAIAVEAVLTGAKQ